jgi:hypothetical protein
MQKPTGFLKNRKEYLVMFLFLLVSANPFMKKYIEILIPMLIFVIFLLFYNQISINKNKDYLVFFVIFYFLSFEVLHHFVFHLDNLSTIIRLSGYFLVSYLLQKSLKNYFAIVLTDVMVFLSIISLLFFVLSYVFPRLDYIYYFAQNYFPLEKEVNPTIIINTFEYTYYRGFTNILRNSGFTTEPGAFASYLNVTIFLYFFTRKLSVSDFLKEKKLIILSLALITTFSTAGYIAFFFLLLVAFLMENKGKNKIWMILIVLPFLLIAFEKLEFLNEKIQLQIDVAYKSQNRFGAFLLDWKDISKRPLTGWSRKENILFGDKAFTHYTHRPNGISNLLRINGFLYFLPLVIMYFYSFKNFFYFCKKKDNTILSLSLLITILLLAFSQLLFNQIFFISLLFFSVAVNKKNHQKNFCER